MTQQTFWVLMLLMQGAGLVLTGGIVVWIFKMGRWMGTVENELENNRADHMRFNHGISRAD